MTLPDDLGMPTRQMHLSANDDGTLSFSFFGDSPTGEGNVSEVAGLVVRILNANGEQWSAPSPPNSGEESTDALSVGPEGELRMQVSRVPHDPEFWRAVRLRGGVSMEATPSELADHLIEAIRAKSARYSPEVKRSTTLILDGQRSFVYDSPMVVTQFASQHLIEAQAAGFADILLLGSVRLVTMLNPPTDEVWWRAS